MKVYLSSTFRDLEPHRAAAARAIMRSGHQVVQMEYYVADDQTPLDRVVDDVQSCDAFVGLYAWQRGSIPLPAHNPQPPVLPGPNAPAIGVSSYTEWEFAAARSDRSITTLVFVLDDTAPWPLDHVAGIADPDEHERVVAMRRRLRSERLVSHFRTPDDLESSVAAALASAETTRQLRVFRVTPLEMDAEQSWSSTEIGEITEQLQAMLLALSAHSRQRTVRISLSTGWWSTRLFLLAFLCERLTQIRRILVTERVADGARFVGLVPTDTAVDVFRTLHPRLERFIERTSGRTDRALSLETEADAIVQEFRSTFTKSEPEARIAARAVNAHDLARWFGHAMLTRPLQIGDIERPTPLELAMVMHYPHEFVPIELTDRSSRVEHDGAGDAADDAATVDPGDGVPAPAEPRIAAGRPRFQIVEQADLAARIAQVYVNDQLRRRY